MTADRFLATEHLRIANHVRVTRSRIKREIKAGKRSAASVIANPPDRCERMALVDVLRAQDQWGDYKVARWCRAMQVYERRALEDLTDDQRARIVAELGKA